MSLAVDLQEQYLVSSARFGEDLILRGFLPQVAEGFYVDIGCGDPVYPSATKFFYDRGWRGINIDPRPETVVKFLRERARDVNCCLRISDQNGESPCWIRGEQATFDPQASEALRAEFDDVIQTRVKVRLLNDVLAEHSPKGDIHFLRAAAENRAWEILTGLNLKRYRPWVIVMEITPPEADRPADQAWEPLILDRDYTFVGHSPNSRYYVANEKREASAASSPANLQSLAVSGAHLEQIVKLEEEHESLKQMAAQLETQNRQLKEEGKKDLGRLEQRYKEDLEQLKRQNKQVVEQVEQRNKKLEEECSGLKNKLEQLELQNKKEAEQLGFQNQAALEQRYKALEEEQASLRNEIKQLKQQWEQFESERKKNQPLENA